MRVRIAQRGLRDEADVDARVAVARGGNGIARSAACDRSKLARGFSFAPGGCSDRFDDDRHILRYWFAAVAAMLLIAISVVVFRWSNRPVDDPRQAANQQEPQTKPENVSEARTNS